MKNLLLPFLLGIFLISNSCQKENDQENLNEKWEAVNIEISEYIFASQVVDSTLVIASKNYASEINTLHEVTRHELEIPEYWQLQESIFSEDLLLRIFAVDTFTYLEFRPIRNLSEKYVLGYDELGINNRIRGVRTVESKTNGVFINSTKFAFAVFEFINYSEFVIEIDIRLNETADQILDVEVSEIKDIPIIETSYGGNARVSNIQSVDNFAFFSMGALSGSCILENGQIRYEPSLSLKVIYEESNAWYSTEGGNRTLKKSENQGLTWETTGIETIARKFRRIGNQTLATSEFNEIFMVGESIEEIMKYDLEITPDEEAFDLIEYFNGHVYIGYSYYPETKAKFLRKKEF